MRSINENFYHSKAWRKVRAQALEAMPLCEDCLARGLFVPAAHVHHKIHLNAANVNDASIALNVDNLESLCIDCHNKRHFKKNNKRYSVADNGDVIGMDSPPD